MQCQDFRNNFTVQGDQEVFKPMTVGFRMDGLQGNMVAHVGHAMDGGRHCALVSIIWGPLGSSSAIPILCSPTSECLLDCNFHASQCETHLFRYS